MMRRLSRAMPDDETVDECRNCPEWITFLFGQGWFHVRDGMFQCDWTQPDSGVAQPVHWPAT